MKILLSSYAFPPSVGGLEEVSEMVAHGLAAAGHDVRVLTMTPAGAAPETHPFEILRRPRPGELFNSVRWCDAYLQMNVSLRLAWPLLFVHRPWVVALHGGLNGAGVREVVKRLTLRRAHVVAVSGAIAEGAGENVAVLPNPYRESVFRNLNPGPRPYELVFLGRLVSDKGAHRLIEALALLRAGGLAPRLLIIGSGPEETALREQCERLQLNDQVEFAGLLRGHELARRLNECRIMVVPSIWEEPFGIVALEGIACGCVVVGSEAGGLPEAIGPCGCTFPKGDVAALASRLSELLRDPAKIAALRARAPEHLARHRPDRVSDAYLAVLQKARVGGQGSFVRSQPEN
jgi:glycogen(starch) synthase